MFARRATASRHIVAFSKQLVIMLQEARLGKPGMVLRCMTALDTLVDYATSRYGLRKASSATESRPRAAAEIISGLSQLWKTKA